jgi:hypothetical protein
MSATRRTPWRPRPVLIALTVVSLLTVFAPARVAAVDLYTWTSCNWSLVDHGSSPNYTYRIHNFSR